MYIVKCNMEAGFFDVIFKAIRSGYHFEADYDNLTVTFTGGY